VVAVIVSKAGAAKPRRECALFQLNTEASRPSDQFVKSVAWIGTGFAVSTSVG
jgi:hypothetical protein